MQLDCSTSQEDILHNLSYMFDECSYCKSPLGRQTACQCQVDSRNHVHTQYHLSCSSWSNRILVHKGGIDFASHEVDMYQANKAVVPMTRLA